MLTDHAVLAVGGGGRRLGEGRGLLGVAENQGLGERRRLLGLHGGGVRLSSGGGGRGLAQEHSQVDPTGSPKGQTVSVPTNVQFAHWVRK